MEKRMLNLKFMNEALKITNGNEFRLLYVIANNPQLKEHGRTKIYRDMMADMLNLSTKQITRLTDSLVEKGLLRKDLVSENGKTVCFYALNLDKNVPLNKSKKELKKEKRVNNRKKEEKEVKVEEGLTNEVDIMLSPSEEVSDSRFNVECYEKLQPIPSEEDLGSYLRRVGRL